MLALAVFWLLLGACAFVIGNSALSLIGDHRRTRFGDSAIQSLWLGLVLIEWLALLNATIGPVKPWAMFPIVGIIVITLIAANHNKFYSDLCFLWRNEFVISSLIVLLATAFAASSLNPTPDTGGYHYPAVRWIAEHGYVVGLANIMPRLGFVSSVFAIVAPFDSLLPGHALPVANGFVLCLVILQLILSLGRIVGANARLSDWFLSSASLAILCLALIVGSETTSTPDLSIMALTVAAAWCIMKQGEDLHEKREVIPLIMACGALNAKLSGLLLVLATALFAVNGKPPRGYVVATLVSVTLIGPFLIAGVMTSGCVALPTAVTCLPVSWALPISTVQDLARGVWEWSRWGANMPHGASNTDWIVPWLLGRTQWLNAAIFWPFLVTSAAYAFIARKNLNYAERWILALIMPSILLVFITAPDLRFNFSLFIIPAALLIARLAPAANVKMPEWARAKFGPLVISFSFAGLVVISSLAIDFRHGNLIAPDRFLLPQPAPISAVTEKNMNGLRYFVPENGSACWGATLPCADQVLEGVTQRNPARGLDGGFMRAPVTKP